MYSFLSFSLSLSFSVSELGGFGRTGRQARRQAGEESRGGVKFNVAKVQLCEKFLRDEVDECLVYIKPFYNKVSLSADWITIFAT